MKVCALLFFAKVSRIPGHKSEETNEVMLGWQQKLKEVMPKQKNMLQKLLFKSFFAKKTVIEQSIFCLFYALRLPRISNDLKGHF